MIRTVTIDVHTDRHDTLYRVDPEHAATPANLAELTPTELVMLSAYIGEVQCALNAESHRRYLAQKDK